MSGKSEEEILETRKKEVDKIYQFANNNNIVNYRTIEVNIINSYIDDEARNSIQRYVTNVVNWDMYWLSQSLQKLAMADALWLCDGWEHSKGCRIELECAIQYELDIIHLPEERREDGE